MVVDAVLQEKCSEQNDVEGEQEAILLAMEGQLDVALEPDEIGTRAHCGNKQKQLEGMRFGASAQRSSGMCFSYLVC